jgi:hypothetical protein
MKFIGWIKDAIKVNDLFYSSELLRFNNEMEYRTLTGGLFSLFIIVAVMVGFANMIIDTLSLNSLSYIQTVSKEADPSSTVLSTAVEDKFMIAVELWGVNMTEARYFDVLMIQLSTKNGQKDVDYKLIALKPCTLEHWAAFPEISKDYNKLSMSSWLCPPVNTSFPLSGKYSSDVFNYINISVNPCLQYLDYSRECATNEQVKKIFHDRNDAIMFRVYYTNPVINAGQKDYKSYYL